MKIVLLIGPSTAGKSTLCTELKEKHQWNVLSFDEIAKRVRKPAYLENFDELSLLMTDSEIYQLCQKNTLTISNTEHRIDTYPFTDASLPSLEVLLKQAAFDEYQVTLLSEKMRSIISSYVSYDQIMDELFITLFKQFDDDSSVVLDVIPDRFGNANDLMKKFETFCHKYRKSHSDLNAFTALVYCPPVTLSERIQKRNHDAIIRNTPHELRKGLFPFQQLTSLITLCNQESKQPKLESFSKKELQEIVSVHSLVNQEKIDNSKTEDTSLESTSTVKTEKNTTKSIEYQHLKKKFGFFKHQKQGTLSISEGLHFDLVINTATDSPYLLTEKLLSQISIAQPRYNFDK